ncbi:MAG TPA: aminoglycoside phosphotransferase family protein [Chloroflexota bacterium]|nr:aminoglycoside phosphotransferase family protein [Chloroflexota bacterium]
MTPESLLQSIGIQPLAVTPVTGGWDTKLWRVRSAEGEFALRVFQRGKGGQSRELAAMRAAAEGGIPVPRVLAEGEFEGQAYMLLSWCAGVTLADALARQPWRALALGRAFGRAQARIHALSPEALPTTDWIAWAGPRAERLRPHLERAGLRSDALLHLDYHPRNVLVKDGEVSAVLDWTNARRGDPRADCARTLAILRFAPTSGGPILGFLETVIRRYVVVGWRRGYREVVPLGNLLPFEAWAGAVLLEDLTPKLGQSGLPLTAAHLDRVRRWTDGVIAELETRPY